jgi:hypothetical protein
MAKLKNSFPITDLYLALLMFFVVFATVYGVTNFTGLIGEAAKGGVPGHGAPSGPHYNLNIIGVPKEKKTNMTVSQGHRIFVSLEGDTRIDLVEGSNFRVLDANGTDGKAVFQLPNPDPDKDGVTRYSVWSRALSKPGGKSTTDACAQDTESYQRCSDYSMVLVRSQGQGKFNDVSEELLFVYVDLDFDGLPEPHPLFDPALMDYLWKHDNKGLKLAQLRLYPIPSEANLPTPMPE